MPSNRWATALVNRFALPLFLFHSNGTALARTVLYVVLAGRMVDDREPDLIWWWERPLAVLGHLPCTLPVIALFSLRRGAKRHPWPPSGHPCTNRSLPRVRPTRSCRGQRRNRRLLRAVRGTVP